MAVVVSGKSEVSSVIYKVGESMQELIKLWKEYESSQADKDAVTSPNGPTLEIRIPAEHVTATNRQVRSICCVLISLGRVMFPIGELCHLLLFPRQFVLPRSYVCDKSCATIIVAVFMLRLTSLFLHALFSCYLIFNLSFIAC